ncbi:MULTISPECIES: hypothetical protein [Pseudonocardia]
MVDADRVRRLLVMLERYRDLLARSIRDGGLDDLGAFAARIAALAG